MQNGVVVVCWYGANAVTFLISLNALSSKRKNYLWYGARKYREAF